MRSSTAVLGLLLALAAGPTARADEAEVLRRLDALAAALERVEVRLETFTARLDRLERRLAEVETFLQRLDQRLAAGAAAGPGTGDAPPAEAAPPAGDEPPVEVTEVILRNKRVLTAPDTGDEYLFVDVEATVRNLRRAGRIKATFALTDRFDAVKQSIEWTTGVLRPGQKVLERNVRFRVTRSAPEDLWLRAADLREIRGRFEVLDVVYGVDVQDGPTGR